MIFQIVLNQRYLKTQRIKEFSQRKREESEHPVI